MSVPFRFRIASSVRLRAREVYGANLSTEIRKIIRQPPETLDLRPRLRGSMAARMNVRLDDHTTNILHAISKTSGLGPTTILARIVEHLVQTAGDTE